MALLLVTAFFCVAATALGAVPLPFNDLKIIGGSTTHIDDARFMVQVSTTGSNGTTFCGGTLISTTHVLTAAHCVPSPNEANTVQVFVGTSEFLAQGKNGRTVQAKALRAHPKFQIVHVSDTYEYAYFDVAVIRLQEAVQPSAKTAIITLPKAGSEPKAGASIQVAGWGYYRNKEVSRKLRIVTLKVKARAQCLKDFGPSFKEQEICTSSSTKSAFCDGDSGGPAFIGNVQYGVVSWGSCGTQKPPSSVFANLADPQTNSFVKNMIRTL